MVRLVKIPIGSEPTESEEQEFAQKMNNARVARVPKTGKKVFRRILEFLGLVEEYTEDDILRLKEAGVKLAEAKAIRMTAEAELQLSTAAEKFALTAQKHAEVEAERRKLEIEQKMAEDELLISKAEALERIAQAINTIRQNGGTVSFDQEQLQRLLEGEKNQDH
ncbi:MAG: hypothetical protein R8G66_19590 [Cytophagales bacterium]|nr:hypothetical protein [Cytophagales bacterium]